MFRVGWISIFVLNGCCDWICFESAGKEFLSPKTKTIFLNSSDITQKSKHPSLTQILSPFPHLRHMSIPVNNDRISSYRFIHPWTVTVSHSYDKTHPKRQSVVPRRTPTAIDYYNHSLPPPIPPTTHYHRINLRPLIRNIIDHAKEWKNTLGNILAEKTKTNLSDLQMELKVSEWRDCCRSCKWILYFYITQRRPIKRFYYIFPPRPIHPQFNSILFNIVWRLFNY